MSTMLKKQPFLDRNNSSLSSLVGLAGLAARSSTVVHTDSNTSFLDDKPKTPDNEPISEADLSPRYGPRESELHASRSAPAAAIACDGGNAQSCYPGKMPGRPQPR